LSLSIITATYNASNTLPDCLECIAKQSVDVEHILIDGASTDATMKIIDAHREQLAHVVSEPDEGIYDAMNKGLKLVSGDVIGILNADDFYPSDDTLVKVLGVFDDPEIEACYGDLVYVDGQNTDRDVRFWRSGHFDLNKFYWGWMPPHPTFFVRRSVYERYGDFNLELGSAADYEIMLRFLLKQQIKVAYIPEVLVHMRTGGVSNMSLRNRLKANQMDRKAWEVNELKPYPWTLIAKPLRKLKQWVVKK
jgi:glycosyltransferase